VIWILISKHYTYLFIRDGSVSIDELIRAIVGEMNEFRKNLIIEAFNKMDRDGSGDLTVFIYLNFIR
jgi:Ca2+-binding EF-hand superfamily protein